MKVAKAKGRLRGKQPKLRLNQAKHLLELHDSGDYTQAELAELFGVSRSTIYRTIDRMRPKPVPRAAIRPHRGAAVPEHRNQRFAELSAERLMTVSRCGRRCRIQPRSPNLSRGFFVR